jgi:hypothetical protein
MNTRLSVELLPPSSVLEATRDVFQENKVTAATCRTEGRSGPLGTFQFGYESKIQGVPK